MAGRGASPAPCGRDVSLNLRHELFERRMTVPSSILLHETEIDSLIEKGFLAPERRHDQGAVEGAINAFICSGLGPAA